MALVHRLRNQRKSRRLNLPRKRDWMRVAACARRAARAAFQAARRARAVHSAATIAASSTPSPSRQGHNAAVRELSAETAANGVTLESGGASASRMISSKTVDARSSRSTSFTTFGEIKSDSKESSCLSPCATHHHERSGAAAMAATRETPAAARTAASVAGSRPTIACAVASSAATSRARVIAATRPRHAITCEQIEL